LLTIPMQQHEDVRHPSMNLGQAVAVCLYELVRRGGFRAAGVAIARASSEPGPASAAELERLTALFMEVLEQTGYRRHHPANCDDAAIRRLVLRMHLSVEDAPVWMGMLRQILWRVRAGEQEKSGDS
jgi:tRNA/rRNA methyltransferase